MVIDMVNSAHILLRVYWSGTCFTHRVEKVWNMLWQIYFLLVLLVLEITKQKGGTRQNC